MSEFSADATLDVGASQSTLQSTKQTIEDELSGITFEATPELTDAGGGGMGGGGLAAAGGFAGTTDLLGEGVDLADERNALLHDIRDFAERGALNGGGGDGGGGILDTLLPVGVMSSLAGGSLLSGGLAVSASSVLSVTGTLGLAAAGVLAVSGYLGLNATNVLTVTGALGVSATAALAFSGSLALSATSVLGVTGVLGLGAASVLAVSGVLGLDVANVLGVTGAISMSAASVMAVTGALSLPAAAVLGVTGALTIAAGDVLDINFSTTPVQNEFTEDDSPLDANQGTATTTDTLSPSDLEGRTFDPDSTQESGSDGELSAAEKQRLAMENYQRPGEEPSPPTESTAASESAGQSPRTGGDEDSVIGGTNRNSTIGGHNRESTVGGQNDQQPASEERSGHTTATGRNRGERGRRNMAREQSQQRPQINYNPTWDVDFSKLERTIKKDIRKLKKEVKQLRKTINSIERGTTR